MLKDGAMKPLLAGIAMLASLLTPVACSPRPQPAEYPAPAAMSVAERMPLPDCAGIEAIDAGADGWTHPDCRLVVPGDAGLALEARFRKGPDESTLVTFQVVGPGDATLQTIEETMGNTFQPPQTQDVDLDDRADILVPLETGNVNTNNAIWLQGEDGTFKRAGELSGVSILNTESGYIAAQARSSAAAWSVEFWRVDGGVLFPVATAEVTATGEDDGTVTGVSCEVLFDGDIADIGLTPKQAEKQFCAEPAAADIFK